MADEASGEASENNIEIFNEFRANQGRVGGMWTGTTLILIYHIGARSGIERVTPVACSPQGEGRFAIWAANDGAPTHPNWYYNLKTHPRITVEAGDQTFTILAQELDDTARAELWPKLVAQWPKPVAGSPDLGAAQARTSRQFPLLMLTRQDRTRRGLHRSGRQLAQPLGLSLSGSARTPQVDIPGSGHLRRRGSKSWPPSKIVRAQTSKHLAAGTVAACRLRPRRNSSLEESPECQKPLRHLRHKFPGQPGMWLCHESIYQAVYLPGSPLLRPSPLAPHRRSPLRTGRDHRRAHQRTEWRRPRFEQPMLTIRQRPFDPLDRSQAGHWEGDLIIGKDQGSAIGTLVERQTRMVRLLHMPYRDSDTLHDALRARMADLPRVLLRSITWDQGTEMARHLTITRSLGAPVYFCDSHSPWQRGRTRT